VAAVDFLGLASGRDMDKFTAAGLTPVRAEFVDAPYVAEFPMVIECRLAQTVELGLHTQFIGEIVDVKVDAALLDEAGHPSLPGVDPLVFAPGRGGTTASANPPGRHSPAGARCSRNSPCAPQPPCPRQRRAGRRLRARSRRPWARAWPGSSPPRSSGAMCSTTRCSGPRSWGASCWSG
jgi:hypothetical protein